jgi:hypothetical protein
MLRSVLRVHADIVINKCIQQFLIKPVRISWLTSCVQVLHAHWSSNWVTLKTYYPLSGVTKAVYFFARFVRGICHYPLRRSSVKKMVVSPRSFNTSWITDKGYAESSVIPFKRRKSMEKRNLSSFLGAMTMGDEYGDDEASITSFASISLTCSCIDFFATEYRYGGRRKGFGSVTTISCLMKWVCRRRPLSSKMSTCLTNNLLNSA